MLALSISKSYIGAGLLGKTWIPPIWHLCVCVCNKQVTATTTLATTAVEAYGRERAWTGACLLAESRLAVEIRTRALCCKLVVCVCVCVNSGFLHFVSLYTFCWNALVLTSAYRFWQCGTTQLIGAIHYPVKTFRGFGRVFVD